MILRETTVLDPRVERATRRAEDQLKKNGISYRIIDGLAVNRHGVGRPTFDIDFLVSRKNWAPAIKALTPLTVSHERMGLPGEPEPAAFLQSREGPFYEIFPSGISPAEIAKLRGRYRSHPARKVRLGLRGNPLVGLINSKLASYLTATDRHQDLADVVRLIKKLELTADYGERLAPEVRACFRKCLKDLRIPVRYNPKGGSR